MLLRSVSSKSVSNIYMKFVYVRRRERSVLARRVLARARAARL